MSLRTYDIALEGERVVVIRLVPGAKACLGVAVFILATLLVTLIVSDPHVLAVVAAFAGVSALVAAGLALRERTEVTKDALEPQVVETVRRAAPDLIEFLARNALRAEAGDEVILTRRGHEVARLVPVALAATPKGRRALMERVRATARGKALPGADAARSQDFLYGDDGMPA